MKSTLKKIAMLQGQIMLSLPYFLIGSIVALLMKLFRHDPLAAKVENDSFWQDRKQKLQTLENYLTQF